MLQSREPNPEPIVIEEAADWSQEEFDENMQFLNDRGRTFNMEQVVKVREEAGKSTDWEPVVSDEERKENAKTAGRLGFVAPENDVPSDQFDPGAGGAKKKGTEDAEEFEDWTKEELMERAQELDIPGRSTMDKEELTEAIDKAEAAQ